MRSNSNKITVRNFLRLMTVFMGFTCFAVAVTSGAIYALMSNIDFTLKFTRLHLAPIIPWGFLLLMEIVDASQEAKINKWRIFEAILWSTLCFIFSALIMSLAEIY